MRWATLVILMFAAANAFADTRITLTGTTEVAEVCRFQAGDREKPIERWLSAQSVTCIASDPALTQNPTAAGRMARSIRRDLEFAGAARSALIRLRRPSSGDGTMQSNGRAEGIWSARLLSESLANRKAW